MRQMGLQEVLGSRLTDLAGQEATVTAFYPINRSFRVDWGMSCGLRSSLKEEFGIEVVFTDEEKKMQGRIGLAAQISEKAAELAQLMSSWMTAPN